MKLLVMIAVLLAAFISPLGAQTVISVDINRAYFTWTWSQGNGGTVDYWTIKCGSNTGSYNKTWQVTDPNVREYPIKTVIGGNGTYYCVISASNQFGESPNSPEVFFAAGVAPLSAGSFGLVVK